MWRTLALASGMPPPGGRTRAAALSLAARAPVMTDPLRGRLESRLRELGRPLGELAQVREHSKAGERAEWARALYAAELPARAARVAGCGTLRAAVVQNVCTRAVTATGYAADRCRDRLCPRCASMRAHELGHDLRALIEHEEHGRAAEGTRMFFVTLTQPKDSSETPGQALARLARAWQRTVLKKWKAGERLREVVCGGVRAIELTYSDGRTPNKHGYIAKEGWHAHIHAIVEASTNVRAWWPQMRARWLAMTGGDGSAQHCQALTQRRIGQLCKYPVKPFELRHRKQVRAVALALDGARLLDGWGRWRGWQGRADRLRRQPVAKLRACGTSLAVVLAHHAGTTQSTTPCAVSWKERDSDGKVRDRFIIVDPSKVIAGGYIRNGSPELVEMDKRQDAREQQLAQFEARLSRAQGPPATLDA